MDHTPDARYNKLMREVNTWCYQLEQALLRWENRRRKNIRMKVLPPETTVFVPSGINAEILMLNIKVWTLRYHVTLDFIFDVLMAKFSYLRKRSHGDITLGIPANIFAGAKARMMVEEAIRKEFPNGENLKSMNQPIPRIFRIGHFENPDQMMRQYALSIEKSRKDFNRRNTATFRQYRRNFRRG